MLKHWQHTEVLPSEEYQKFMKHNVPFKPSIEIPYNTAIFVDCETGGKRLEGIYDGKIKMVRPLKNKTAPNRDLRLYLDAIATDDISIIAVDGLMGTGKTSTCIEELVSKYLINAQIPKGNADWGDWKPPVDAHKIMIAKPHINAGGSHESYGFLPGDLDDKLDPILNNFIQYFDRYHPLGFEALKQAGYIEILPLGFIRGLDAKNMTIIADETQNTKELISVATRKANNCRIFFLGDTSPFQIDLAGNTSRNNGLTHIIELLRGAPYFQYIEMKTLEHIVRSEEVRDIVRRLFKKYGQNPQEWMI